MAQCETADSLTFEAVVDGADVPRKLLSARRRDPAAPDVLWRLKVYPGGNGVAGYLALYAEVAARHALPAGWAHARALSFTLHHPTDPAHAIVKHTTHTFTAAEPDWGYNQVIAVPALAQRGFLAHGAVRITATFRPVPAPAPLRVHTPPCPAPGEPAPAPPTPSSPAAPDALRPGDADDENGAASDQTPLEVEGTQEDEKEEEGKEEGAVAAGAAVVVEVELEDGAETEAFCRASEWWPLDAGREWRLVVCRDPGAAAVSAYADVRARDAAEGEWPAVAVAVSMRVRELPATPTAVAAPATFVARFSPEAPRHGVPLLALLPPEAHGRFVVCATAEPTTEGLYEEREEEEVDAQTVEVQGVASYVCTEVREAQARGGDVCVLSPWHALGTLGRWRLAVYPAGRSTAREPGWVAAVVAFRASATLAAVPGWSLRVLLRADVRGPATTGAYDACLAVLDATHSEVALDRLVRVRDLVPADDEDDDGVLTVTVVLATCSAGAPTAFAEARLVAAATAAVAKGADGVQTHTESRDSAEGVAPLAEALCGAGRALCAGVAGLERALARETEALARTGTSLDSAERLEGLRRRLAALCAERERCVGRGCTAEELDAREHALRALLKKLMCLQAAKSSEGEKESGVGDSDDTHPVSDCGGDAGCDSREFVDDDSGDISLVVVENMSANNESNGGSSNDHDDCGSAGDATEVAAQCEALAGRLCALGAECRRVGAVAGVLGDARARLARLVTAMPGVVAAERAQRAACAQTEQALAAQCAAVERECRLLRGDDAVLGEALAPEHVSACVDFIVEAVGQMAVAKYLTKK